MDCCERDRYDVQFDAAHAQRKLREYRRHGPAAWTGRLIAELSRGGVDGLTVLDIGAGIGAVHQALLASGAASATDVDASGPYLEAARDEAVRRGVAGRVTYVKGDAVGLADELPEADLVALDRVVCCYGDMGALVRVAASHTRRRLGMVLPQDRAWIRAGVRIANALEGLRRDPFRFYAHRIDDVVAIARTEGLDVVATQHGLFWQTLVLERPTG